MDMFMRLRIRILSMMISGILVQLGQEPWAQKKKTELLEFHCNIIWLSLMYLVVS